MRPLLSTKYPSSTRDACIDCAAESDSTSFANMFFAPARSYSTTADDAREYQFNCGSELRFSKGNTASRCTIVTGCRAQPPAITVIRIVLNATARVRLQNT